MKRHYLDPIPCNIVPENATLVHDLGTIGSSNCAESGTKLSFSGTTVLLIQSQAGREMAGHVALPAQCLTLVLVERRQQRPVNSQPDPPHRLLPPQRIRGGALFEERVQSLHKLPFLVLPPCCGGIAHLIQ